MSSAALFGLVLAGGESRRMGEDKALLRNRGESQLSRAVRLLEPQVEKVFVSTRASQADEDERARFAQIVDAYEGIGPVAGILSAMDAFPDADWLVVACDLPNLSSRTIEMLLEQRGKGHPLIAFASVHNGLPEPLCAVYKAEARPLVAGFVDQGVHCPRKMMINSDTLLLDQPDPDALDNINTPEDLRRSVLEAGS